MSSPINTNATGQPQQPQQQQPHPHPQMAKPMGNALSPSSPPIINNNVSTMIRQQTIVSNPQQQQAYYTNNPTSPTTVVTSPINPSTVTSPPQSLQPQQQPMVHQQSAGTIGIQSNPILAAASNKVPSPTIASTPPSSIEQAVESLFKRTTLGMFASPPVATGGANNAVGTPPIAGSSMIGHTFGPINPSTPPSTVPGTQAKTEPNPNPAQASTTPAAGSTTAGESKPAETTTKPEKSSGSTKTAEEKQRDKEKKEKEKKEKEAREKEAKEKEAKEKEAKEKEAKEKEAAAAAAAAAVVVKEPETEILGKRKLTELLQQISSNEKMDEEVEDILSVLADDFVESVVSFACTLAKHRNSNSLEVKDLQCHLERNWNIRVPGFGNVEQIKSHKKQNLPENHRLRLQLMRKSIVSQSRKLASSSNTTATTTPSSSTSASSSSASASTSTSTTAPPTQSSSTTTTTTAAPPTVTAAPSTS